MHVQIGSKRAHLRSDVWVLIWLELAQSPSTWTCTLVLRRKSAKSQHCLTLMQELVEFLIVIAKRFMRFQQFTVSGSVIRHESSHFTVAAISEEAQKLMSCLHIHFGSRTQARVV